MEKKVSEIWNTPYGQDNVPCEPSTEEIERAVRQKDLEKREFQKDLPELIAEWRTASDPGYYDRVRKYHTRRIAFFVVNGWGQPIVLNQDQHTIKEGLHRLKAAIHLRMEKVDVEISDNVASQARHKNEAGPAGDRGG